MSNPVIYNGARIGQISAEADDEFLFKCFVDHPALSEIRDSSSPKMILLGSTGIGKTAFLRMIERQSERCHNIELQELSLSYISNSDIISFLMAVEVPMDHFFQALWKHVICIEYIKLRFKVDSEAKSLNFWQRIRDRFGKNEPKRKALLYLERWERKFWVSFDESVREITQSLERQIQANFSSEIDRFKADVGYARKLSEERKSSLQQRLKKFVDADLLSELAQVINLLSEYDVDAKVTNFVLIDKLDENWVSGKIRVHLIRALIEALKSLRRIHDLKVVVAMRSDVMEKVIYDTRNLGFQSEKYEDYVQRVVWSSDQLKSLVNKRINYLFSRKYDSSNVFFENVFTDKIQKEKTISYLIDRTLMRPRDMITFVNICLEKAAGKASINQHDVLSSERIYSENRKNALIDEWRPMFPGIEPSLRLLEGRRQYFNLYELNTTDFVNSALNLFYENPAFSKDGLVSLIDKVTSGSGGVTQVDMILAWAERLYLVGAVGVNASPSLPVQWFFKSQRRIDKGSLDLQSKVRIHPMLFASLGIQNV